MDILLIGGGWSNERDVSLKGSEAIARALDRLGHRVCFFDPAERFADLPRVAAQSDFAFINLHGSPGEDGLIQALLDRVRCPYQGSGPRGSLLALNKAACKKLLRNADILTPDWEFLPAPPLNGWSPSFEPPLFLKPNNGGSSLDIRIVRESSDFEPCLAEIFAKNHEVLVEKLIPGREVTCGILGDEALPPILIQPADSAAFFDYRSKYTPDAAKEICPAPISGQLTETIQSLARQAHELLGLKGYSRTDFILLDETPFALEVNTLPGMTSTSLLPQAARAAGMSFEELIARLIELGLQDSHPADGYRA
jgi:D-alanine-D-alanine ligase